MFFKKGLAVKKVKKYIKTLNGKGTCSRRSTMAWNQTGRWLRNNIYQRSRHIIIFNHIVILSQNKITLIYLILPSLQSWSITTNTFTTNGITNFSQSIQPNWLFQSVAPSRVIYIRLKGVTHHPVLYFTIQITKKYCTAMCYISTDLLQASLLSTHSQLEGPSFFSKGSITWGRHIHYLSMWTISWQTFDMIAPCM